MKADPSVKTPKQYIAGVPKKHRSAIQALHDLIRKTAPSLKPHIQYGMLGYGPVKYRGKSGSEGDWFVIGLASQKNYMSLYFCVTEHGRYLAEAHADRLGRVNCGKSCVRFTRLENLNLEVAAELIQRAEVLNDDGHFCQ